MIVVTLVIMIVFGSEQLCLVQPKQLFIMKKASSLFNILILLLFCVSCSKDDDAPITIPTTPDDSFFEAKINGVEYKAKGNQAVAFRDSNYLSISSLIPDGRSFYLYLGTIPSTSTFSYPVPDFSYLLEMRYAEDSTVFFVNTCFSNTGELKITSITENEVSGTFFFTAKKSGDCLSAKNITEGSFKLKINQN